MNNDKNVISEFSGSYFTTAPSSDKIIEHNGIITIESKQYIYGIQKKYP